MRGLWNHDPEPEECPKRYRKGRDPDRKTKQWFLVEPHADFFDNYRPVLKVLQTQRSFHDAIRSPLGTGNVYQRLKPSSLRGEICILDDIRGWEPPGSTGGKRFHSWLYPMGPLERH
ncbi:MAG: hypothetical protein J3Q66DRAFT_369290 [Benniella sp.]|nr:MAG: hypothetical protein J3Q66DRAFT_369290 [Benniella sp.]